MELASIIILMPSFLALWSFEFTRIYYRINFMKWISSAIFLLIFIVFLFLSFTSSSYSLISERVMFLSNMGYYELQFSHSEKRAGEDVVKQSYFCLIASDLNYFYMLPIININKPTMKPSFRTLTGEVFKIKVAGLYVNKSLFDNNFEITYTVYPDNICPPLYSKKHTKT